MSDVELPLPVEDGLSLARPRLETEATFLSLAESQLALAALASLCAGERDAVQVLRRLLRRVHTTSFRLSGS
jgi:hypothetical protein